MSRTVPTNLKHKPIYAINDYDRIDGMYKNNTDVHAISIGKAQWSNTFVPGIKVWRNINGRWSRQSEETTITRALDMAMLSIKILDKVYHEKLSSDIVTPFGSISVTEVPEGAQYLKDLENKLNMDKKDIEAHINLLRDAINEYFKE